jgi:hypothetical protein
VFARRLQEVIGGQYGEITVMNQYLFQGWNCRHPGKYKDLIMGTGVEELGHVEMLATMVARLLEGASLETQEAAMASDPSIAAVIGGMNPQHAIVTGAGRLPQRGTARAVRLPAVELLLGPGQPPGRLGVGADSRRPDRVRLCRGGRPHGHGADAAGRRPAAVQHRLAPRPKARRPSRTWSRRSPRADPDNLPNHTGGRVGHRPPARRRRTAAVGLFAGLY